MASVSVWAGALLTAWAASYAVVAGVAVVRATRPGLRTPVGPAPSVLLVRPCTGEPDSLQAALRSTAELRYRGKLSVLLTVADPDDPAWPHVLEAARGLQARGLDAHALLTPTEAPNRKVGQLAEATRTTGADVVVGVDADVDLHGFDLDGLVAPLTDGDTAAAWAPPVEVASPRRLGDHASAAVLGASLHAFPLLGVLDPGGLVGKTFAVRTDALRRIGGFDGLGHHLGEDMELARRLDHHGWRTRMHTHPVRSLASGRTLAATIERYTRWLWVIRAQRPTLLASYPLLLAAAPLLLGLLGLFAMWSPSWGAGLLALVLAARLTVAWQAASTRGRRLAALTHDWLLADVVLLAAFGRVLGPPRVRWGRNTLRLDPGGRLRPLEVGGR